MEQEMCSYLEWRLVEPSALKEFESMVRKDFKDLDPIRSITPRALFGAIRASEAEYQQHSDRHPIIWARSTSIPALGCLHDPIGEVLSTVVGRILSHTHG